MKDLRESEKVFKALGSKTRLKLLRLLWQEGELPVTLIARRSGMTIARVSRNLGILENVGLVKTKETRTWVFYSINTNPSRPWRGLLLKLLKEGLK
ncbi:helix-turn-helix domain-containing protein [bacterium]|nr:helix-turn-helix domain-containing protein [bacterium]MCG2676089.1 helix-turn-helix domain-containing protein [bacterium]MCG2677721.1 helix-turn-helix domain-containing protein [bacterium]